MSEPIVDVSRPQEDPQQLLSSALLPYDVSPTTLSPEVQKSIQQVAAEPHVERVIPALQDTMNKVQAEIPAANTPEHQAALTQLMQGMESGQMKQEDILAASQQAATSQPDMSPEDTKTVTETFQTLKEQQRLPQESRSAEVVTGALQRLMRIGKIIIIALAAIIGFGMFKGMGGLSSAAAGGGQ